MNTPALDHVRTRSRVHSIPQEARALYEWLHAYPEVQLELLDVISQSNSDAAAFIVRRPPDNATAGC